MPDSIVITARIPRDLKKKLDEMGVNLSSLVRRSLEAEIKRLEIERLQIRAENAGKALEGVPQNEIVEAIRAGRESR